MVPSHFLRLLILIAPSVLCGSLFAQTHVPDKKQEQGIPGILLEQLTWDQAERILTPSQVVVIPLGAESKEHGRHLHLNNDWIMAEYLKEKVIAAAPVVVGPTVNYSYYPAFLEYPGSTSLKLETARDMIVDICHTLAAYGPHKFYVLNTGLSTLRPLKAAAEILAAEGVVLRYTNLGDILDPIAGKIAQQPGGTHADEVETSMMLYIAPSTVNMKRALKDFNPQRPGPLTRDANASRGVYSPTGAWGDPTLATKEKGKIFVEATVKSILAEIHELQELQIGTPAH